jgi:hypothetical protein
MSRERDTCEQILTMNSAAMMPSMMEQRKHDTTPRLMKMMDATS